MVSVHIGSILTCGIVSTVKTMVRSRQPSSLLHASSRVTFCTVLVEDGTTVKLPIPIVSSLEVNFITALRQLATFTVADRQAVGAVQGKRLTLPPTLYPPPLRWDVREGFKWITEIILT